MKALLKAARPGETPRSVLADLWLKPWKLSYEARRLLLLPLARAYFLVNGIEWGGGWRVYGLPLIQRTRGSTIEVGSRFNVRSWFHSNPLGLNHRTILATWSPEATIRIGDVVGMTGATICAQTSIEIGSDVRIGANSTITDTDFHPIDGDRRSNAPKDGESRAVRIGNGVFIGMNSLVLKGVSIGDNAVVGAGSVVTRDVPSGAVVAGNPAKLVRAKPEET